MDSQTPTSTTVPDAFPGFSYFDKNIYLRHPPPNAPPRPQSHPRYILIFGWGDAQPKHLSKDISGYTTLYPSTSILILPSQIMPLYFTGIEHRAGYVQSIIPLVYPQGLETEDAGMVVAQVMSNVGCTYYSSLLYAFKERFGKPLPHQLLVLDSTPGSTGHTPRNIYLWSAITAITLSKRTRLPYPMTFTACVGIIFLNALTFLVRREKFFGTFARDCLLDPELMSKATRKLYMYSKGDSVIYYKQIEDHVAEGKGKGWEADVQEFDGTEHVSHGRVHGEQYWGAIKTSWQRALDTMN